ncbi:MAG TPA: hypothetical protein DCZ13_10590 [Porticoccaceae bacterium]|nr:hypothetical protein [Porticoccaceae bacterium]
MKRRATQPLQPDRPGRDANGELVAARLIALQINKNGCKFYQAEIFTGSRKNGITGGSQSPFSAPTKLMIVASAYKRLLAPVSRTIS